ncbi:hypothetical protein BV898_07568 [Hypsibius exemplaris]|uniref:Uncharacterized protein n=1 Tax=Hypsibius exemplaris TaxID=2072580 RepID=A0A1W0WT56_HYPEX|nr:hypothetical protein BV898_07568 [Hypsibius exemplaris]
MSNIMEQERHDPAAFVKTIDFLPGNQLPRPLNPYTLGLYEQASVSSNGSKRLVRCCILFRHSPEDASRELIGHIVTDSDCIPSQYGDEIIFFRQAVQQWRS